ncbi:CGNR zinc finger domain-containing protein [Saccharopolyspora erythraea]|uniref:CGNR zinc finger domain-containing protein n=1 Tax=Saccharopolyspora erythraea TaxID=1836 RepID=UPI001BA94E79|nr:CGNR zinc finger domain-containing protein [Saccharopolyspora erythraea]QUH01718.1 CGNR zinc finger domain-containing protein [Saccharopolyspora erythraea]
MDEWVWESGRRCLDLVNTYRDRYRGGRELLLGPGELAEWLVLAGLLGTERASSARPSSAHLRTALELREAVDRAARARARAARLDPPDIDLINRTARHSHLVARQLRQDDDGVVVSWAPSPGDPVLAALGALAADAVDLLATDPPPAVRVCAADRCGIRFLDGSPAGNRQWCSMRRCGNREKARQHYARRKARP